MKLTLVLVIAGLCTLAAGSQEKVADKAFLEKQKDVLYLFYHINQPLQVEEYDNLMQNFNIEQQQDLYTDKEVFQIFIQCLKYGYLPKGEIFSVFYEEQLREAIVLFKMFYYAKDYNTFLKTAIWARKHLNEGLFLYSYSVALLHRTDTKELILPPIYEIYPYYFFNTEVIQKAYIYKQMHGGKQISTGNEPKTYTIESNYSGYYLNLNPEQSMSYYLEDIGINSFYYYTNLYYPFWMSSEEFPLKDFNRGEHYYFLYQQLLARYYLERLSNGFGEIPYLNWNVPIETPYYPSLEYPNGLEFPARPQFARLYEYFYNYGQSWTTKIPYGYSYSLVQDYERRINDVIDKGYLYNRNEQKVQLFTKEGINILGNIIESNPDSPDNKFYGPIQVFARHLLGYSYQPLNKYKIAPSALEHFETSMRDPMFYQLYKKLVLKFQKLLYYAPAYTQNDLVFPGVQVQNFEIDSFVTYFDYFYSGLYNAVYQSLEEEKQGPVPVRARQYRLNHKPYNYKLTVNSEKDNKAVVRVFIGPKYDEYGRYINISENRLNFVILDYFTYDLKSGENIINRSSYDAWIYAPDSTSYYDLYKQVMAADNGKQEFKYQPKFYGYFPQRYMLPKGTPEGMTFQLYVIVYPYVPKQVEKVDRFYQGNKEQEFVDSYPLQYPFDRFIKFEKLWYYVPNSHFLDVKVYHKDVQQINVVQSNSI